MSSIIEHMKQNSSFWLKGLIGLFSVFLLMGVPAWMLVSGSLDTWVSGSLALLFALTAAVAFFIGFFSLVCMRKCAGSDEGAQRYQALQDAAIDSIISINEDRIICSFNKAAERMFGYSADEVIGKNIKMLMPEKYARDHDSYVNNYIQTGIKKVIGSGREVEGLRKDRSVFPMHL